jgi:N-acetylglucosaminyldiphosphoundecaprenol N-acetyl-beta-D-mannosaminyltransferase
VTGADCILPFSKRAAQTRLPLYFLGGELGVAKRAADLLVQQYPGLNIQGAHHGHLDAEASETVLEEINQTRTKVLLVGMGTPRQELWIAKYRPRISAPVVWAVGGLFDVIAGVQHKRPQWMVDHHLEWVARLLSDPRRLWKRYLIGNPLFVARVLRQRFWGAPKRLDVA